VQKTFLLWHVYDRSGPWALPQLGSNLIMGALEVLAP